VERHEHPAARRTDLALIDEDAKERAINSGLEIRIGKEDVGGLAAQLESHALKGVGRRFHDQLAHRRRSGKGHLVYAGVGYDSCAGGFAQSSHDIDDSSGNTTLHQPACDLQHGQRRLLGRL
jgi:hypothetical protein